MDDNKLSLALAYAARKWSIIPMRLAVKRPACKWKKYQTQRAGESQIGKWFADGSDFGVAVVFGTISGNLASRDFDDMETYQRWAADHAPLANELPTVETGRGRHVYFQANPDDLANVRRRIGKPDGTGAINCIGGEFRAGVGCYSVVPPSPHSSGKVYRWIIPLPDGELPIVDIESSGLGPCNRENGEDRGEQSVLKTVELDGCATRHHCLQFSLQSLSSLVHERIQRAIERTMPTGTGLRHKNIFQFARELKAIDELKDVPAKALKPILRTWHQRAQQYYKATWEEHWFDFAEAWDGNKIKWAAGEGAIDMIFAKAISSDLPEAALEYEQPELRILVALCRELQRAAGDSPFFLDVRTAGRLLEIDHTTASRWMRGLQRDEILKLVSRGELKTKRASRYRYVPQLS